MVEAEVCYYLFVGFFLSVYFSGTDFKKSQYYIYIDLSTNWNNVKKLWENIYNNATKNKQNYV